MSAGVCGGGDEGAWRERGREAQRGEGRRGRRNASQRILAADPLKRPAEVRLPSTTPQHCVRGGLPNHCPARATQLTLGVVSVAETVVKTSSDGDNVLQSTAKRDAGDLMSAVYGTQKDEAASTSILTSSMSWTLNLGVSGQSASYSSCIARGLPPDAAASLAHRWTHQTASSRAHRPPRSPCGIPPSSRRSGLRRPRRRCWHRRGPSSGCRGAPE